MLAGLGEERPRKEVDGREAVGKEEQAGDKEGRHDHQPLQVADERFVETARRRCVVEAVSRSV